MRAMVLYRICCTDVELQACPIMQIHSPQTAFLVTNISCFISSLITSFHRKHISYFHSSFTTLLISHSFVSFILLKFFLSYFLILFYFYFFARLFLLFAPKVPLSRFLLFSPYLFIYFFLYSLFSFSILCLLLSPLFLSLFSSLLQVFFASRSW